MSIFSRFSKGVDSNHLKFCPRCKNNIEYEKNHTHVRTNEGYGICYCTKCAIVLLKAEGKYIIPEEVKSSNKDFSFLDKLDVVIFDYNYSIYGL